jgi:ABC-type uncharacterized transport system YnjBCD ATPase subunit
MGKRVKGNGRNNQKKDKMKRKDKEVKVVPSRLMKGQRSRLVLGRCLLRISAGTPAKLI